MTEKHKPSLVPKDVRKALTRALEELSEEIPEASGDYHRLFNYFVGLHFEGVTPSRLRVCDRTRDQKIDFYHASEDQFVAYQCKLPDLDKLDEDEVMAFGPEVVNELEDALTFLTDDKGKAKGNRCSQEARNRYRSHREAARLEQSDYPLQAVLAVFGVLTGAANEKLAELRNNWPTPKYRINVINHDRIATELALSAPAGRPPTKMKLRYIAGSERRVRNWAYALVPAKDLYDAFNKHKMSLFALNVRYYLKNSSVNRRIIRTLKTSTGLRRFHLLNNGVTVSCRNLRFPKAVNPSQQSEATVIDPQVINGCQTIISLYEAYTDYSEESMRHSFEHDCYVPVRFLITDKSDLIDDVVTASNNQNKMSARNLVSNTRTQRVLATRFRSLRHRWFYQRKDGEFTSLKDYRGPSFKPSHYAYGSNRFRVIDNEVLAKAWLSFIGFSKDSSERIKAFEAVEDEGKYEWLFERAPTDEHWNSITLGPQVSLTEDAFIDKPPSAEQYLLSYIIYEFVRNYTPSAMANKRTCIEKLKSTGQITDKSSAEDISKKMMADEEYVLNQILSNMKEVVVELYAWILIKTYGAITPDTARRILDLPLVRELCEKPDFKGFADRTRSGDTATRKNLLFCCYEFIKESVKRWYSVNDTHYLRAQRRIRFLHYAETVAQMKQYLKQTNTHTKTIPYNWKPTKKEFLSTLPDMGGKR